MQNGDGFSRKLYTFLGCAKQVLFDFVPKWVCRIDVSFRPPYNEKIQPFGRDSLVPLELKSTINLPKTDFPMKANLPANEPKTLARWEQEKLYDRIRQARKG